MDKPSLNDNIKNDDNGNNNDCDNINDTYAPLNILLVREWSKRIPWPNIPPPTWYSPIFQTFHPPR